MNEDAILLHNSQHQIMASSSAQNHHHLPTPFAATAAPPPTPSFQSNSNPSSTSTSPDFLSHLLHRLPPSLSLSLPTRRPSPLSSSSSSTTTTPPPIISLSDPISSLLSASVQHGFFHLAHHPIPSHLPLSAESTALSLFTLPPSQKQLLFPSNWPLGHDVDDDDDDAAETFCLDSSFWTESANELNLDALREFSHEMEKLGLKVVEELASAVGFNNPARNDLCSLLWISNGVNKPGRVYPYAVGLHYQIRCQKHSLLSDTGRVTVSGLADSVFVTLGDIAQVWSNGKVKKVRGRPFPSSWDENPNSHGITLSLLITLPVESTVVVCPLVPDLIGEDDATDDNGGDKSLFHSFSFEDYAWRVYHQRLPLKDPLLSYRIIS